MKTPSRRSCSMSPVPVTTVSVRPIRPKTRAQCWTFSLSEHYLHRALRRRERAEKRRAERERARAARNDGFPTQPVEIIDLDPENPVEGQTELILMPQSFNIEPLTVEIPQTGPTVDSASVLMIEWYPSSTALAVPVTEPYLVTQATNYESPQDPCANCGRCNNRLTCQWMTGPSR